MLFSIPKETYNKSTEKLTRINSWAIDVESLKQINFSELRRMMDYYKSEMRRHGFELGNPEIGTWSESYGHMDLWLEYLKKRHEQVRFLMLKIKSWYSDIEGWVKNDLIALSSEVWVNISFNKPREESRENIPSWMSKAVYEFIIWEWRNLTKKWITNWRLSIEWWRVYLYYKGHRYYFTISLAGNQDIIRNLWTVWDSWDKIKSAGETTTLWQWINYQAWRSERDWKRWWEKHWDWKKWDKWPKAPEWAGASVSAWVETVRAWSEAERSKRNLEKNWYDYKECLMVTSYIIWAPREYNADFITKLKIHQKERWLKVDWVLWVETITAIKAELNLKAAASAEEGKNWYLEDFSKDTTIIEFKKAIYWEWDIDNTLLWNVEHRYQILAPFNWSKKLENDANYVLLKALVEKLRAMPWAEDKYKDFFETIDAIEKKVRKDPEVIARAEEAKAEIEKHAGSEEWKRDIKNFVDVLNDPDASWWDIAKAALGSRTWKLLLVWAWIFFLFWAFWTWSKFTDSRRKRWLVIVLWLFWLWWLAKDMWASSLWDWVKKLVDWIWWWFWWEWEWWWAWWERWAESAFERWWDKPLDLPKILWDIWETSFAFLWDKWWELGKAFWDSYKSVMNKLIIEATAVWAYFEKADKKEKLETLIWTLNWDRMFLEMKIDDLESIKDSITIWSTELSDEVKSKLESEWVSDEDLRAYIKLLLAKKDEWDEYVRDLFVESSILDPIKNDIYRKAYDANKWYVWKDMYPETEIAIDNAIIRLRNLWASSNDLWLELAFRLSNPISIEKWNIDNWLSTIEGFLSRTTIREDERAILEELKTLYENLKILKDHIDRVEAITLESAWVVLADVRTAEWELKKVKDDFDAKTTGWDEAKKTDFERAYRSKMLEIAIAWSVKEWDPDWHFTKLKESLEWEVEADRKAIEDAEKLAEAKRLVEAIKLVPFPWEDASLKDYDTYIKNQKDNLLRVKEITEWLSWSPWIWTEIRKVFSGWVLANIKLWWEDFEVTVENVATTLIAKLVEKAGKVKEELEWIKTWIESIDVSSGIAIDDYETKTVELKWFQEQYIALGLWELDLDSLKTNLESIIVWDLTTLTELSSLWNTIESLLKSKKLEFIEKLKVEEMDERWLTKDNLLSDENLINPDVVEFVDDLIAIRLVLWDPIFRDSEDAVLNQKRGELDEKIKWLSGLYADAIKSEDDITRLQLLWDSYQTDVFDRLKKWWRYAWWFLPDANRSEVKSAYHDKVEELPKIEAEREKEAKIEAFKNKTVKEAVDDNQTLFENIFQPYFNLMASYPSLFSEYEADFLIWDWKVSKLIDYFDAYKTRKFSIITETVRQEDFIILVDTLKKEVNDNIKKYII